LTLGDVPSVSVDPQQVCTALVEVLDNAIHATDPKTGQIDVHAAHDPYGGRVVVTIADNGCGMDEEPSNVPSTRSSATSPPDVGADWGWRRRCGGSRPAVVRSAWRAGPDREHVPSSCLPRPKPEQQANATQTEQRKTAH